MYIDGIDRELIEHLQTNARLSFAELGRMVGLSTPAVIERIAKLEDAGVILGYHAQVNPAAVGLPVHAIVRITLDGSRIAGFFALARKIPEVMSCHRVTGADSYLVEVRVRDTQHLESVIDAMMPYVATNTSLVLGEAFHWKAVTPPEEPGSVRTRKKPRK